jgi:hypothetical protein
MDLIAILKQMEADALRAMAVPAPGQRYRIGARDVSHDGGRVTFTLYCACGAPGCPQHPLPAFMPADAAGQFGRSLVAAAGDAIQAAALRQQQAAAPAGGDPVDVRDVSVGGEADDLTLTFTPSNGSAQVPPVRLTMVQMRRLINDYLAVLE